MSVSDVPAKGVAAPPAVGGVSAAVIEVREKILAPGEQVPLWMPAVFCASGFAALLYQVIWQRVLYATFGVNIEAVTTVVTAFLAGLGAGSLLGGWLAGRHQAHLLRLFGAIEIGIGAFGFASLGFFRSVGLLTLDLSSVTRGAVMALIVMLPTTLMGSTLPLLVEYLVRSNRNVGRSVGLLYFVNTAGSAFAALAAVLFILARLGEAKSTYLAACINLAIGCFVLTRPATRSGGQ